MVSTSDNNRYGFHTQTRPALGSSGVSLDFVHNDILRLLVGIESRLSTAANLNPNSTGTQEGLALLKTCIGTIETALSTPNLDLTSKNI